MFIAPPDCIAPTGPPDLAQRLTPIIETLRRMVAAEASRRWYLIPLTNLLHAYLGGVARRFESLIARLSRGPIRPRAHRPRTARQAPPPAPEAGTPRKARIPSQFGWLIDMIPYHAAAVGSQLQALLRDPEMRALMEAQPQAARMLRALCRMLRIEPAADLPQSLFTPRPAKTSAPEPIPPEGRSADPSLQGSTLQSRAEGSREAAAARDARVKPWHDGSKGVCRIAAGSAHADEEQPFQTPD